MELAGRRGISRAPRQLPSFFFVFAVFLVTCPGVKAQETYTLDEVLEKAMQLRLYEDHYWHVLVHYKKGVFGLESTVDDPRFFLAPDGKTNPRSELEYTIRAFFSTGSDDNDSPACRFVARYDWLCRRLGLDEEKMPLPGCRGFHAFLDSLKPTSALLVFPMAHLNSPASMYGHTLLVVETQGATALLAHSVSYSAYTQESFGPMFAVRSILGLYPGYYTVLPYYKKLQEYNDVDHRDIWEYRLNLTPSEIRRMLLHVKELESISSDYFFFDENCSYSLLFLLEAAREGVHLTDKVYGWLIPLESIRMMEKEGMIDGVQYRPSRVTRIKTLSALLSQSERKAAMAMSQGRADVSCEGARSLVYELAAEYLQYLYTTGHVSQEEYRARFLKILTSQSELGPSGQRDAVDVPQPVQPLEGHKSNRVLLGYGYGRKGGFVEFRIRPAYHGLMDRDEGYVPGAHLVFADAALRFIPGLDRLRLESLDAVDIMSLSPVDDFFKPVSWKITTGLTRVMDKNSNDRLVFQINPGAGLALGSMDTVFCYVLMETASHIGGVLENDCIYGIGPSAGLLTTFHGLAGYKVHVYGKRMTWGPWDRHASCEAGLGQNMALGSNCALSLDAVRREERAKSRSEVKVSWNIFF